MNKNTETILVKLKSLIKHGGSIIFSIGDYYIQFSKEKLEKKINFEAVSHHFLDIIPKNLEKEFLKLNFKILDGNYYKTIDKINLETTSEEIKEIFERIYKVNYEKPFEINDDIEYPSEQTKLISKNQTEISPTKTNPIKVIFIVGGLALLSYWLFFSSDKKKIGEMKSEACVISEQYVESQLLSPKTSEFGFCDQSKIIHLGNNKYQVTNYVDAPNAFGASLRKTYFIILKYNSGEWENINNWTIEKSIIE